jgi:thiol-disulfide isomerase/thioredoxin
LLVAACGATAPEPAGDGAQTAGTSALAALPNHTLEGDAFDGESLAGQGVVLWFWAPWCTICRAEAPDVASVAAEMQGDVTFVGVPGLGAASEMKGFVADTGVQSITHLPDVDGEAWRAFGIVSQPSFVFISPDGSATSFTGALGADKLREAAESTAVNGA